MSHQTLSLLVGGLQATRPFPVWVGSGNDVQPIPVMRMLRYNTGMNSLGAHYTRASFAHAAVLFHAHI